MNLIAAAATSPIPSAPSPTGKLRDAAEQFEALLLGQILHSAREADSPGSADSMSDFAEQQLATVMSRSGGLGIAAQIVQGLSGK
jgi:peptidoglycan hydrolase FlgJ